MNLPALGAIIPFADFDFKTTFDRVVLPMANPNSTLQEGRWELEQSPYYDGPHIKRDDFIMVTFERTPEGWRRIG